MISLHNQASAKQTAFYIGSKLIEVFALIALGFWSMNYFDDLVSATFAGICYLIAIGAIMIVIMADDYERRFKRLYRSGKL